MKTTIHVLLSCTTLLALGACASIIEGSTDSVNIVTSPPTHANCSLTNTRGTYNTYTPAPAIVKKSINDLNITCNDPQTGASGSSVLASEIEPWDFGNILLGGIIGMGVDWGTGAAYNYPNSASVTMLTPTQGMVAPAVQDQPAPTYYTPAEPTPFAPAR